MLSYFLHTIIQSHISIITKTVANIYIFNKTGNTIKDVVHQIYQKRHKRADKETRLCFKFVAGAERPV